MLTIVRLKIYWPDIFEQLIKIYKSFFGLMAELNQLSDWCHTGLGWQIYYAAAFRKRRKVVVGPT